MRTDRLSHVTRAFRHRNYQLFFGGQLISLIGTWMQSVAESWLVYRLTGSAALLGVTSFATLIPVFLFATIGGAVADRVNRHRIIITTQTLSMVFPLVPSLRNEARQLIVAQEMAGGLPSAEMTGPSAQVKLDPHR